MWTCSIVKMFLLDLKKYDDIFLSCSLLSHSQHVRSFLCLWGSEPFLYFLMRILVNTACFSDLSESKNWFFSPFIPPSTQKQDQSYLSSNTWDQESVTFFLEDQTGTVFVSVVHMTLILQLLNPALPLQNSHRQSTDKWVCLLEGMARHHPNSATLAFGLFLTERDRETANVGELSTLAPSAWEQGAHLLLWRFTRALSCPTKNWWLSTGVAPTWVWKTFKNLIFL